MTKKPYELWSSTRGKFEQLGSYSSVRLLKRDWSKHFGSAALAAFHNVGDRQINISDNMPKPEPTGLREFRSAEERDAHIIETAVYFSIVSFLGVGQYERHERLKRKEAESLAEKLSNENKRNYIVYAVNERGYQAFVCNHIYRGES